MATLTFLLATIPRKMCAGHLKMADFLREKSPFFFSNTLAKELAPGIWDAIELY